MAEAKTRTPGDLVLRNACRLSITNDKPIMLDYWAPSLDKKALVGARDNNEKLLVKSEEEYTKKIIRSRKLLDSVSVDDDLLEASTKLCAHLGTDGLRGELTLLRGVRALAAFEGKKKATLNHLKKIAPLALGHRLRRNPLDDSSASARIDRALQEFFTA